MSLSDDLMIIRRLSSSLRNFKELSPDHIMASCSICGDSKNKSWLTRLNFIHFPDSESYLVKCFNCDYVAPLGKFLKDYFPEEYNEMLFSNFRKIEINKNDEPVKVTEYSVNIDQMKINAIFKKYIRPLLSTDIERNLTDTHFNNLFYSDNFEKLANEIQSEKVIRSEYPKIVIPLYDLENRLVGIQARSINKNDKQRYIILHVQKGDLFFNINKISLTKTILVTEGAIDSLFLDNAFATLSNTKLDNDFTEKHKSKIIIVLDNDFKNKQADKINKSLIEKGFKVFISKNLLVGKDVEEWHKHYKGNLTEFIKNNAKSGLDALLEYVR